MKKITKCFHCHELNGVVKKCGLLKISHEKYRSVKKSSDVTFITIRSVTSQTVSYSRLGKILYALVRLELLAKLLSTFR